MRVAIVSAILFLSGCSALLFQTLWLRLTGLVFGNSVWSVALILSSFMAGLACGSAIAASVKLGRLRPLRVYAALEIIVAIFGCTLVFALPTLGEWMRPLFQALWNHQQVLNLLRLTFSFVILLIPTTAMGLTLPVLLEDEELQTYDFKRSMSLLYGANTLGAMTGALLGETYLVQAFGLRGTGIVAASVCGTAAAIALLLARGKLISAKQSKAQFQSLFGSTLPWRLLLISAASGAIFLSLEEIWFRFLLLYVASTAGAFAVMLAVVLAGLGLGSLVAATLSDRFFPRRSLLPVPLLMAACATLLSYLFFPIPAHPADLPGNDPMFWRDAAMMSLGLMFPVALLSGALLPAIVSCVQAQVPGWMNSTGLTILFNTIGAAFGPLLAAFVLLPRLGFQSSLIFCALAYAALACLTSQKKSWFVLVGLSAVFALLLFLFPYHRDELHLANARFPYTADGSLLIKKIEGTADTFQLLRRDLYGEPYYYRLVTNSYSMSGTLPQSQRYMRLFAYLPLALRPQSQDALLICYGVGVTADAFTHDPHLKHLDIVDISKEVFELADSYAGLGYANPLRDPRVKTFVQDGRFFLQASPTTYDIISGEPPPLKVAGTVNLYTRQFFFLMKERLKQGGVVSFWLPLYQLKIDEIKAILRAFHDVFENASLWATSDMEWIMIGIKPPLPQPNEESSRELWSNSDFTADLRRIGIEMPEQLPALFVMGSEEIDRLTRTISPLDDAYPKRLTDTAPDLKAAQQFALSYLESSGALRRFLASSFRRDVWPNENKDLLDLLFLIRETRYHAEMSGSNWLGELEFYLRGSQLRAPVLAVQKSDEWRLALAERNRSSETLPDLVAGALAKRDLGGAIDLLKDEKDAGFTNKNDFFLLIYLYCLHGEVEKAEVLANAHAGSIEKDWFVDWLWGQMQAEFGFRPPH